MYTYAYTHACTHTHTQGFCAEAKFLNIQSSIPSCLPVALDPKHPRSTEVTIPRLGERSLLSSSVFSSGPHI